MKDSHLESSQLHCISMEVAMNVHVYVHVFVTVVILICCHYYSLQKNFCYVKCSRKQLSRLEANAKIF